MQFTSLLTKPMFYLFFRVSGDLRFFSSSMLSGLHSGAEATASIWLLLQLLNHPEAKQPNGPVVIIWRHEDRKLFCLYRLAPGARARRAAGHRVTLRAPRSSFFVRLCAPGEAGLSCSSCRTAPCSCAALQRSPGAASCSHRLWLCLSAAILFSAQSSETNPTISAGKAVRLENACAMQKKAVCAAPESP